MHYKCFLFEDVTATVPKRKKTIGSAMTSAGTTAGTAVKGAGNVMHKVAATVGVTARTTAKSARSVARKTINTAGTAAGATVKGAENAARKVATSAGTTAGTTARNAGNVAHKVAASTGIEYFVDLLDKAVTGTVVKGAGTVGGALTSAAGAAMQTAENIRLAVPGIIDSLNDEEVFIVDFTQQSHSDPIEKEPTSNPIEKEPTSSTHISLVLFVH
ncbi:unnamed protein product [Gongylonema pulchrum]|uniref:Senescence domain-containing protein n=1 Tax=Gongylonema pulchrum TaxID=637853 RepID=A0A183DQS3_9BILA|nr:unnamed protein product [Gongylonema pulchrum]